MLGHIKPFGQILDLQAQSSVELHEREQRQGSRQPNERCGQRLPTGCRSSHYCDAKQGRGNEGHIMPSRPVSKTASDAT